MEPVECHLALSGLATDDDADNEVALIDVTAHPVETS